MDPVKTAPKRMQAKLDCKNYCHDVQCGYREGDAIPADWLIAEGEIGRPDSPFFGQRDRLGGCRYRLVRPGPPLRPF